MERYLGLDVHAQSCTLAALAREPVEQPGLAFRGRLFRRRPELGPDLAIAHVQDPVAEAGRAHLVGGEHDRLPCAVDLAEGSENGCPR